ncbi:hypothetical protein Dsin_010580 [Dipteronia sinensis]|uniref:RNase H type-1 domain-containing protein n=1 Tax=Dipteronia sinensis TaxID=43782 RepID=A0AAE0EEJ0_9ROSI|nr:hypothetical protein Dsin_010580 [Dipteronia sinensis]
MSWSDVNICFNMRFKDWLEAINQLIFKGTYVNLGIATKMVKFRVAWWFKHCGRGLKDPVSLTMLNIKDLCIDHYSDKRSKHEEGWAPSSLDSLKFNVDGSARGQHGSAGIGGVLRDANGKKIMIARDSKVVVSWINSDNFGSIDHLNILYDIRCFIHFLGRVNVCFSPRSTNSFADKLAKLGSSNIGDKVVWGDI